jgi:hypothetical protein
MTALADTKKENEALMRELGRTQTINREITKITTPKHEVNEDKA